MSGNTFGHIFTLTSFGESHGVSLGVVIDGFPPRIKIDGKLIEEMLSRRRTGQSSLTTQRKESDSYRILSGVYEGYTTGTPIAVVVENENQKSSDYSALEHVFRPGHADFTYFSKYGIRDHRGGGRSSGRETVARVIGGAFAVMALREYGISVDAGVTAVGNIKADCYEWDPPFAPPLYSPLPDEEQRRIIEYIESVRKDGDSTGSVVECRITGVPAGLGEPVFDKLDALLAHAVMSIGGVKGFEVGNGFKSAGMKGSENNDPFSVDDDGTIEYGRNNAGGILGGISSGSDIIFRAYFKPTPSIRKEQITITDRGENTSIKIEGRHDPCIGIRAAVVVEAMAAAVILDSLLFYRAYRDGNEQ